MEVFYFPLFLLIKMSIFGTMETVTSMRGVLGGFKNMLRQWRINYLRHKKKKQREIEENKLAQYYTLKRIAYSGLALIYYPFGLFHTKAKEVSKDDPDLARIEESIISIQKKRFQILSKQKVKEIRKIETQIQRVEKKIEKVFSDQDQEAKTRTLQHLKQQVEYLKQPPVLKTKNVSIKKTLKQKNSMPNTNTIQPNENYKSMKVQFSPLKSKVSPIPLIVKTTENENVLPLPSKNIEKEKIKKLKEALDLLSYKITITEQYPLFYDYEKKLKACKQELEEMLAGFEKAYFMELLSDIERKERKKPVEELLEQVTILEKTIVNKKKQIYNSKPKQEKSVVEKKQDSKEETKEKKKKETKELLSEWQQAELLIMQQIEQQQKQLNEFNKKRGKNGQKGLFHTLSHLASNTIGLLFSIAPFAIFKNKILGTLVTTIMVNNSLKSMRKLLHPQEEINYQWLGQELRERQAILKNIYYVSEDSLYQIGVLKEEVMFLLQESPKSVEILSFLQQLESIEKETLMMNERVKKEANIIDKQYTKIFTRGA